MLLYMCYYVCLANAGANYVFIRSRPLSKAPRCDGFFLGFLSACCEVRGRTCGYLHFARHNPHSKSRLLNSSEIWMKTKKIQFFALIAMWSEVCPCVGTCCSKMKCFKSGSKYLLPSALLNHGSLVVGKNGRKWVSKVPINCVALYSLLSRLSSRWSE